MVPWSASEKQREQYVDNILTVWQCATSEQEQRGRSWYRIANELARVITGGDARAGAGVLAALSANKSWPQTCRLARQACETGLTSGHFGDALAKATVIAAGTDPAKVLPMDRKTGHFFRCIADPGDTDAVVIDRHAHDIAVGDIYGRRDRGLSGQRYELLAAAYREAAQRLGELPSTVQAVTWVVHTDRIAGTGTRPPRT
ncbi:DUF7178 family protein [Streptomyces armeniacus]|uniref:DUF7178 family protein n=1 Tax=Streptomyces armeniacus TaxID=83291 RepID=UPI001FE59F00|nr:hypothetical protein [Streptomyces armeniacus]